MDVVAAIDKEQHLPQPLKDMVHRIAASASAPNGAGGVLVETNGHIGEYSGAGVTQFRATVIKLVGG